MLARIAIVVGVLAAGTASAETAAPAAQIAVDFERPQAGAAWVAPALEELVGRELLRFNQVRVMPRMDGGLAAYKKAGADVVVLGWLRGGKLHYEVHPGWSASRAFDGNIDVAGVSMVVLQRHVGDILRPIVQRGGLLDQKPSAASAVAAPVREGRAGVLTFRLVLLALIGLLAFPAGLLLLLVGPRALRWRRRPASWKWSALLAAAIAVVVVVTGGDYRKVVDLQLPVWLDRLVPVTAGMLWGVFVLIHLRWAFAPIHGMGQVRHHALGALLRSWLALSLLRVLLLAVYAPVVLVMLDGCDALALSSRATWALCMPAAGLFACFWLLTLVDNLAVFLDTRMVTGAATDRNPWHSTVRRYFLGYVRRHGIDLDLDRLERVLFLPSSSAEVISYGGGFARPRVLVGQWPRELALGELPDEREAPEREVNPDEWPYGVLSPARGEGRDAQKVQKAHDRRRVIAGAPPKKSVPKPKLIGEHLTLLGWVLPQPGDDGLPLIASTQEEYEIVRALLQEHYAAFEKNLDDEEVDDTDPTQRDFLFGALIREIGAIIRGDSLLATLRHALTIAMARASLPTRSVMRAFAFVYVRLLAGPATTVADAYAAFHGGLHHLIQYLDLQRGKGPRLTTRANQPQLIAASKEIFDRLEAEEDAPRDLLRPTPRNRLIFLSRFFHAPPAHPVRRLVGAVAVLAAVGVVLFGAVRTARQYHPVYVDRMQKLERELVDARRTEKE